MDWCWFLWFNFFSAFSYLGKSKYIFVKNYVKKFKFKIKFNSNFKLCASRFDSAYLQTSSFQLQQRDGHTLLKQNNTSFRRVCDGISNSNETAHTG